MKLCVSMWSMHRKFFNEGWSVLDYLDFCKKEKIQSVELLDVFWKDQAIELPQVQKVLDKVGITVGAYAVTDDFVQEDEEKRRLALNAIVNGIQVAKELDTRVIRVFAGDIKEGYDFSSSLEYIVNGLQSAASVAASEGIVLALENHGKLAGRSDQVQTIIERVGSSALRSTFDMGNFLLVDEDPMNAYHRLSSLIGHVHVKDLMKNDEGKGFKSLAGDYYLSTICGEGQVPIGPIFDSLAQSKYQGALSLEFEGSGDEAIAVQESVRFLQPLLK